MPIRAIFFLYLLVLSPIFSTVNLESAFEATLKRSELVAEQNQLIIQTEERYRQAVGSLLPSITGIAAYQKQQSTGGGNIFPSEQPLIKVMLNQPLLRGFREFAALRQADKLTLSQKQQKLHAERQLFIDLAGVYFTWLTLQKEIDSFNDQIKIYQKRIAELNERIKIGRSRITEVLTVQSQEATLQSQIINLEGQLKVTKETFVFITGITEPLLHDYPFQNQPPAPLQQYLTKIKERPDYLASVHRLEAAKENVTLAKGAHYPSLDLNGNYYFKRAGILDRVHWDVQLLLTVPIFNGGTLDAKVGEAKSQEQQSELISQQILRQAEQEIKSLHATVISDLEQIEALEKTRAIATQALLAQQKDYRNGLVTNLEVLQAITAHEEAERSLSRSKYLSQLNRIKLEAASEQLAVLQRR